MKKLTYVLAILVCLLAFAGVREASAAEIDSETSVLSTFDLLRNGVVIPQNATLYIEPNATIILEVDPTSFIDWPVATSGDPRNVSQTLGVAPDCQNQTVGDATVNLHYNIYSDELLITANGIVDGTLKVQMQTTVTDLNGAKTYLTDVYSLRLKTGPVTDLYYLYVPKSISIRKSNGDKVSNVEMTASKSRTYEVWADDYNKDGVVDKYDYDVFPVNDIEMVPTVESENESDLMGVSSTPNLLGLTPTMTKYPTKIATITITARNPGGDQSSAYDPVYTDFYYQIAFSGTTGSGVELDRVLPNEGEIQTPPVSVRINALDDAGGDGEDSGGSCSVFGAGALLFLVIPLSLRRKAA